VLWHDFQLQFLASDNVAIEILVRGHSLAAAAAAATPPLPPRRHPRQPASPRPAKAKERRERINLLLLETGVFWQKPVRSFQAGQPGAAGNRT